MSVTLGNGTITFGDGSSQSTSFFNIASNNGVGHMACCLNLSGTNYGVGCQISGSNLLNHFSVSNNGATNYSGNYMYFTFGSVNFQWTNARRPGDGFSWSGNCGTNQSNTGSGPRLPTFYFTGYGSVTNTSGNNMASSVSSMMVTSTTPSGTWQWLEPTQSNTKSSNHQCSCPKNGSPAGYVQSMSAESAWAIRVA